MFRKNDKRECKAKGVRDLKDLHYLPLALPTLIVVDPRDVGQLPRCLVHEGIAVFSGDEDLGV